jgi:hypothetical protein
MCAATVAIALGHAGSAISHPVGRTASRADSRSVIPRGCAQAARRARFPVACPVGLPDGTIRFWASGFGGGGCGPAAGRARLPRWTWVGADIRAGRASAHLVVASAPRRDAVRAFIYAVATRRPYRSPRVVVAGATAVTGHSAQYVHPEPNPALRAENGELLGRTVLIWAEQGHTYAIGVTGGRGHARRIKAAAARRLVLVRWRRGAATSQLAFAAFVN